MKTAEQTITRIVLTGFDLPDAISLVKKYAKQVAEQALNDAADNADIYVCQNDDGQEPFHHLDNIRIDRDSILNTKILTP